MNRSITSRNLAGGFLGGAFGILISWYVAPMALPFGVLLGVVVGWWAEDIVQMFVHSFHAAQGFWRALMEHILPIEIRLPHRAFVERFKTFLNVCATKVRNSISCVLGYAVVSFHWLAAGVRASARIPTQVIQWASHPSSTAFLITISAITVGAVINAFVFAALWPWPETMTIGGGMSEKPEEVVPFTLSDIAMRTCIVTLFLMAFGSIGAIFENSDDENPMRAFYARWERYSHYSPATYCARELFRFFVSEVASVIFLIIFVVYWVTLGGALIALVVIPMTTLVAFMIGLCKIAQRSAHWWCLGITLIVTGVSALVFYNSFNNELTLWTVALCTGLASGIAVESLRHLSLWWSNTETGQHYLDIWHDEEKVLPLSIATPAWTTLVRAFDRAFDTVTRLTVRNVA